MLGTLLTRVRWSVVVPLLCVAPVTVPVTAEAAVDAWSVYTALLEDFKLEGECPAGTDRVGCE